MPAPSLGTKLQQKCPETLLNTHTAHATHVMNDSIALCSKRVKLCVFYNLYVTTTDVAYFIETTCCCFYWTKNLLTVIILQQLAVVLPELWWASFKGQGGVCFAFSVCIGPRNVYYRLFIKPVSNFEEDVLWLLCTCICIHMTILFWTLSAASVFEAKFPASSATKLISHHRFSHLKWSLIWTQLEEVTLFWMKTFDNFHEKLMSFYQTQHGHLGLYSRFCDGQSSDYFWDIGFSWRWQSHLINGEKKKEKNPETNKQAEILFKIKIM